MAQEPDYIVENSDGATFRAALNRILGAIMSSNSGTAAPANSVPGMLHFARSHGNTGELRVRLNQSDAWHALATAHRAPTPPDHIQAGMIWIDSSDPNGDVLKFRNVANSAWIETQIAPDFPIITYSPTEPARAIRQPGMLWFDTSGGGYALRMRNGSNTGWDEIADTPPFPIIHYGSTAPASPGAGQFWYDTSGAAASLKLRNKANNEWREIYPAIRTPANPQDVGAVIMAAISLNGLSRSSASFSTGTVFPASRLRNAAFRYSTFNGSGARSLVPSIGAAAFTVGSYRLNQAYAGSGGIGTHRSNEYVIANLTRIT